MHCFLQGFQREVDEWLTYAHRRAILTCLAPYGLTPHRFSVLMQQHERHQEMLLVMRQRLIENERIEGLKSGVGGGLGARADGLVENNSSTVQAMQSVNNNNNNINVNPTTSLRLQWEEYFKGPLYAKRVHEIVNPFSTRNKR